jgi:NAD(P)-dependent dehydrogenase (short-subunit alcohol dehydrogenase family)
MDLGIAGRTALVTGASRGIGHAIAAALAREGVHLHLAARSKADLAAARDRIRKAHDVRVDCHALDLGAAGSVAALASACGDVDILVNNAGAIPLGNLVAVDEARWREAWELKVFGFINLSRAVYARMCGRRSGVIVNVIGVSGERLRANYIAGSTGNAALMAFTRALGGESVDHGVRVVGVNPGQIETDRLRQRMEARAQAVLGDPSRWQEIAQVAKAPMGRFGRPDEIADAVTWLASERASYVSGIILTVDGGRAVRNFD